MYLRRYLFIPLVLIGSVHSQIAPSSSTPSLTFKTNVRVVLVDVVVTDNTGHPITGLPQKDFQVSEDGKPQKISFFEEHNTTPTQIKLPPMPPNIYTNYPTAKTPEASNILLLDWLNTQPQDRVYVHAQLIKYLANIQPGTSLAVFTLGSHLRLLQGFTTDISKLTQALNDKKEVDNQDLLPTSVEKDTENTEIAMMRMNHASPSAIAAVKDAQEAYNNNKADVRVKTTLQAMRQLSHYLAAIPGRKNVIWFSGYFPISIFPNAGVPHQYLADIQQNDDLFNIDRVSVYPVAAQGFTGDATFESEYSPTPEELRKKLRQENTINAASRITMEEIANDSGGRAFYNTNAVGDAMIQAINDGDHYYTFTYTPTNKDADGKYRHVEVKTPNGHYQLSYRRGYYAENEKKTAQIAGPQTDPLLALLQFGLPDFSQVLFKIKLLPSKPQPAPGAPRIGSNTDIQSPFTRYSVDFAISVQDLKFDQTPDGIRHGDIEVMMVAYDHEGKPLNMTIQKAGLLLKPAVYKSMEQVGLQINHEIDLPAGDIFLRMGVFDLGSNQAGTLVVPLNVPLPDQIAATR